jgi:hypothetical protein
VDHRTTTRREEEEEEEEEEGLFKANTVRRTERCIRVMSGKAGGQTPQGNAW